MEDGDGGASDAAGNAQMSQSGECGPLLLPPPSVRVAVFHRHRHAQSTYTRQRDDIYTLPISIPLSPLPTHSLPATAGGVAVLGDGNR